MHSSVNNRDTSTSILSIGEMIGIVVVFSFLLYLLFPKQDIEEIIETKGKNTNLSINYLESMLLYYPDNIKLEMILIQNYDYENKRKKAFELIHKVLSQTKDKEILDKLYRTEYRLLKEEYFDTQDKKLLPKIKEKLYNYYKFTGDNRDYVYFFAEATQMNFKKLKYISLKGLMRQKPELINYRLEKEAYFLASYLKYKDDAHNFLINLTKYPQIDQDLKDNALSTLLNQKEYDKAIILSTKLFQNAKDIVQKETYFNIALYATSLAHINDDNKTAINELIDTYKYSVILDTHNIYFILDNLLKVGDIKGASRFALESFDIYSDRFDENCTNLAIKAMIYNQDLKPALNLALFAEDKFKSSQWLDRAIELSTWQGKMKYAVELNIKGYREYRDKKYEKYLLEKTTLNSGYEILGEIYRKKVESGDYSFIDKVAEYFDYTAQTLQGEEYFTKLLKNHKTQEILKQAISFSYKNNSYKKGIRLYYRYKSKYGIDKNLQKSSINKLIALKKFKKAYILTQELETKDKHNKKLIALMKKLKIEDKFHIYKKLKDFAWIYKDYKYLYRLLWKLEARDELQEDGYSKLITLDQELNRGERLTYLYQKVWEKTHKTNYLMSLLYAYMDKQNFQKFTSTRDKLSPKYKKILEKDINYNILLANYYAQTKQIKKASKYFATALKLDPHSSTTHQAYIWFLIDNRFNKQLKKELQLLRKNPKLQKEVGFPSVVGALQFQKTDLALRWLTPLLKSSDSLEYQIVYADILQLQDREEGATKVRLKLFRKLNKMIKKTPKLLEDKAFARVYLRLVVMFTSPYERKNLYFKKFKHLFNQKDFMDMKIGWKSYIQSEDEVKYLASKYHMNLPWLRLYIAMSRGDTQAKQELLKNYKDILAFRDRVTATKDIGDRAGAYSLAFQGMEDNQRDVDLYKIYEGMVNSDYPKGGFKSRYKKLSSHITDIENRVSYRWRLYKGINANFSFHQYRYIQDNNKDYLDNRVALSLNNSYKRVIWSIEIAKHFAQRDFISSIVELSYKNSEIELGVEAKYHNKTHQTTQLQMIGIQNSIKIDAKRKLSNRINIRASYRKSSYQKQNREKIGSSEQFKVSGDYLLRAGYPDIRFTTYLLINRFRGVKENLLPKDFIELGSQISVGVVQNQEIHQDLRPFGVLGLSINDRDEMGTSLSLGLSGALKGGDVLNLSIDYSKGMDMISYPYYGISLDYRF